MCEAKYSFHAAGGEATIRALANYMFEYEQIIPRTSTLDLRGDIAFGLPALQGDLSLQFARGDTTALLSGVYIGSGSYRKRMSSEVQNNHVPHVWYIGASIDRRLRFLCNDCSVYASMHNLFDRAPPHPGFRHLYQSRLALLHRRCVRPDRAVLQSRGALCVLIRR